MVVVTGGYSMVMMAGGGGMAGGDGEGQSDRGCGKLEVFFCLVLIFYFCSIFLVFPDFWPFVQF